MFKVKGRPDAHVRKVKGKTDGWRRPIFMAVRQPGGAGGLLLRNNVEPVCTFVLVRNSAALLSLPLASKKKA